MKLVKRDYPHLGGTAPSEDDGSLLHVLVYLQNEQGDKVRVATYGRTTDEAIADACDFAQRHTGVGGWAMDEWEPA